MKITDKMIEAVKAELLAHGEFGSSSAASEQNAEIAAKAVLEIALSASPAGVVKPLEWRHDGSRSYAYCGVTDTTWTAENQEGRNRAEQTRAARIMSAIEPAGVGVETVPYQNRVADAHYALFHDDPTDIPERNARAFEEAIETAQAFGMTRDEAVALVDYTFSRPVGDPAKEIGAKILTAFSLGVVAGIDVMAAAEADLEKLQRPETIARVRAKRATRHGRGPLPGFDPAALKGDEQ